MAISEFRYNRKRKHPSYVFKKKNNKYHSLLITHSPKSSKRKNVKLFKNPNPNDSKIAYLVVKIYKDDISLYNKPYKNWNFHINDKRKVKRLKKKKKSLTHS